MKIVNEMNTDYHIHSSNFSDGLPTIYEIVRYAGELSLKEIAITDHSREVAEYHLHIYGFYNNTARFSVKHFKNVFNNVNVIFGVEADLLNENGDICSDIQGKESDFIILSAHEKIYEGDKNRVTEGLINAIEKFHDKIKFIGHPYDTAQLGKYTDMKRLVDVCNRYKIPLEINAKCIIKGSFEEEKLRYLITNANELYFNSDAHSLGQMRDSKKHALEFLKSNNYL